MYFAKRMLAQNYPLPVPFEKPENYTSTLVASVSGAYHTIYEVPPEAGGWYLVQVAGASGFRGHDQSAAPGGATSAVVFVYGGSKVLLWGGSGGATSQYTDHYYYGGTTGYPAPSGTGARGQYGPSGSDGVLGGGGAGGTGFRGGGGGGGAAGNGGTSGYKAGGGGAGAGCIIGVLGHAASTIGIHTVQPWEVGNYKVAAVTAMVLGGGGAGGYGDDSTRSGGAGGGAWGNGGANNSTGGVGGTGPGGSSFGVGGATSGVTYGNAGYGAWCIRDFTTGTMTSGVGGGVTPSWDVSIAGYAKLYRLNAPTDAATYRLRINFEARDIETEAELHVDGEAVQDITFNLYNSTEYWLTPNSSGGGAIALGSTLKVILHDIYGEHILEEVDLTSAVISGGITIHANNTISYSNSVVLEPELLWSSTTAGAFSYTVPEDAVNLMIEIGGGKGGECYINGRTGFSVGGFGEVVRVYKADTALAGETITGVVGGNGGYPTAGTGDPAGSAGGSGGGSGDDWRGGGGGGATSVTIGTEKHIASGGGGATVNNILSGSGAAHAVGGSGGGPNGGAPGAIDTSVNATNGGNATGAIVSTANTGYVKIWKNYK